MVLITSLFETSITDTIPMRRLKPVTYTPEPFGVIAKPLGLDPRFTLVTTLSLDPSGVTCILLGPFPASSIAITSFIDRSITDTVLLKLSLAYSFEPSGVIAAD